MGLTKSDLLNKLRTFEQEHLLCIQHALRLEGQIQLLKQLIADLDDTNGEISTCQDNVN